eukprot:UN26508
MRAVNKDDSILITGASRGIGRHAALAMNVLGFKVFVGIRKNKDGESLKGEALHPENMIPVILDVTNEDQIEAAVKTIDDIVGENGLTAVFNNAGVYSPYTNPKGNSCEHTTMDTYKWVMDVNHFGSIRITKAFLPLVKKHSNGRIIFNTSLAGLISHAFGSAYSNSKFATESFADALRR